MEGYELATHLLGLLNDQQQSIAGNNLMALGAIHAIKDRQLSLPGDISIVSLDDREWAQLITPLHHGGFPPTMKWDGRAAELVMRRLEKDDSSIEHSVLESEIFTGNRYVR